MTGTPPSLRDRIDAAIRPAMLIGLQDAELYDEPGRARIGEWADSITRWVLAVVQPELDQAREAGVRKAAAMLRRFCPQHGDETLATAFADCHCPAAYEIARDASTIAARDTTS